MLHHLYIKTVTTIIIHNGSNNDNNSSDEVTCSNLYEAGQNYWLQEYDI